MTKIILSQFLACLDAFVSVAVEVSELAKTVNERRKP